MAEYILIAVALLTASILSIIAATVICHCISKITKFAHNEAYFIIAQAIFICDILQLTTQLLLVVPVTAGLDLFNFFPPTLKMNDFIATLDTLGFLGTHSLSVLLSLNCLVYTIWPKLHYKLFTRCSLLVTLGLLSIVIVADIALMNSAGLTKIFDTDKYFLTLKKEQSPYFTEDVAVIIQKILNYIVYGFPVAGLFINFFSIVCLRLKLNGYASQSMHTQAHRIRNIIGFSIQGLVISAILICNIVVFNFVMGIFQNFVIMGTASVHSFLFLICNRKIRQEVVKLFTFVFCRKATES